MEMEEKTSLHPSLPSNYVTLAHLQQRWLLQKQQQHQEQQKIEHQQQPNKGFIWKARNDRYRPKIPTDSGTNADNQRESQCDATIGDGNGDRKITTTESAKNEKKRVKPKREPKVEAKTEGKKEVEEEDSEKGKTAISSELNEEKKVDDSIVEEIEQKMEGFSVSAVNNGNGRGRRGYFRHSQYQRGSYGYNYGGGNSGGGFGRRRNEVREKSGEKMVWVRKSDNVSSCVLET